MDIFDEISNEVGQERLVKLLNKYATHIMCLVLLLIGGVVAYNWQQNRHRSLQEAQSYLYYTALQKIGDQQDGTIPSELDQLILENKGLAALATLKKAAILSHEGKIQEADKLYVEVATHKHYFPVLKSLANLLSNGLKIDTAPQEAEERFKTLSEDKANPFSQSSLLYESILLYDQGKTTEATAKISKLLVEPNLATSLKTKSDIIQSLIKASEKK